MDSDGDMDVGGNGHGAGVCNDEKDVSGYWGFAWGSGWGLGWCVDVGECAVYDVEQELELEHDVSRSTR